MRVSTLIKELNIGKNTLAAYLESFGINVVSINQKIEDESILNSCRLYFSKDKLQYKERLKQLRKQKKEIEPFVRLTNECDFYVNFDKEIKGIYNDKESLDEVEFSLKLKKIYLIKKINKYKSIFLLKNVIDSKQINNEKITILDRLLIELNKPTNLKFILDDYTNRTYNINKLRRRSDNIVDDESMIMSSFRNGTSENFGF